MKPTWTVNDVLPGIEILDGENYHWASELTECPVGTICLGVGRIPEGWEFHSGIENLFGIHYWIKVRKSCGSEVG